MIFAKRVYYDVVRDIEEIEVHGHHLSFGGPGDGYCYAHQNFECIENLTEEEWKAIRDA
jgi:hypothetical protein